MDINATYHFLFETYGGIGVLIAAFAAICLLLCVLLERKTRRTFVDRGDAEDSWLEDKEEDEDDD